MDRDDAGGESAVDRGVLGTALHERDGSLSGNQQTPRGSPQDRAGASQAVDDADVAVASRRGISLVGDSTYSVIELAERCRKEKVRLAAPLRFDAGLYKPAPQGKRSIKGGHPRVKGKRLPGIWVLIYRHLMLRS
jgi:hypothetical protein